MDPDLKAIFGRAFDDEPPPPDDLAGHAMVAGTRLRRRRRLLVGGGAAGVVATIAAAAVTAFVALPAAAPVDRPSPPAAAAELLVPPNTSCFPPNGRPPTSVAIFLTLDITDAQRDSLRETLRSERSLTDLEFEGRGAAFAKFQELWREDPDKVRRISESQFPDSFHARITTPSGYDKIVAKLRGVPGIEAIQAAYCPGGAQPGEGK